MPLRTGLHGRRALVTAASKGLGYASASALAREGCRVVLSSSNPVRTRAAVDELTGEGLDVQGCAADLTLADDCTRLLEWTLATLGGLDVLVNNTRGPRLGVAASFDDAAWTEGFEVVLLSAVRLTRGALAALRDGDGGAVVNLTSITARQPLDRLVLSNTFRPAVVAFGKTLAREAAPQVRVNSILTGRIQTDRIDEENRYRAEQEGTSVQEVARMQTNAIPLGRYGRPDELADAVVFYPATRPASSRAPRWRSTVASTRGCSSGDIT